MHWLVNAATRAGLAGATAVTVSTGTPLGKAWELVARELRLDQDGLAARIAPVLRMKLADFDRAETKAKRLLPERVARRYHVHAMRETDR
jgi:hypothetical protein